MNGTQNQFFLPPLGSDLEANAGRAGSSAFPSIQGRVEKLVLGFLFVAFAFVAEPLISRTASASVVTWDVDPTNSYIQLTIPDQTLAVTNIGNVTIRMRDASSTTQWTDAGGRRASLDGAIATEYMDGTSITFLGGLHNLYARETTSLRPNPAEWSAATTNYTGTSTCAGGTGRQGSGNLYHPDVRRGLHSVSQCPA